MSWGNIWGCRHKWVWSGKRLSMISYLTQRLSLFAHFWGFTALWYLDALKKWYSIIKIRGHSRAVFQTDLQLSISVTSKQYRFLKRIDLFYRLQHIFPCHLCDTMTSDQQERKDCSCSMHTLLMCEVSVENCRSRIFAYDWKRSRRLKARPVAGLGIVWALKLATMTCFCWFSWWLYGYTIIYFKKKILS